MKTSTFATSLALAAGAAAQDSICDRYTTALLEENTAENQQTLLTLVVNTAVIGNYTEPNVGISVPGILAPGTGEFEGVELAPYFNGMLASTAPMGGGDVGVSVNFLDGGGAAPLMENMPAENEDSNQFTLLTHLYSYFGFLLGCSEFANTTMQYMGSPNMYRVHEYMALDNAEVTYFITQVGLAAASFGVTDEDVATVGTALTEAFGQRCSPPVSLPPTANPALQAICIADDCPLSPDAVCDQYDPVVEPQLAATTAPGNATTPSPTGGASPSPTGEVPFEGGAAALPIISGLGAAMIGLVAYVL